ncbi:hypothetical protein EJ06DRAFT_311298 [Trichodelitschia bisporula]|uniref:Rhodopsin domain-containing protein n=1 Tax=Trichodelitschia bisporula TaxID=703511 RepID=A0A6G1I3H7_9PEZI|nr:hypothetical protein EJ06DRAFT_311298 [Trichodelitschia bisporula]
MVGSAYIGTPPATNEDYWIAKYMLMSAGLYKADPAKGTKANPPRPAADQYVSETKGPGIIVGLVICLLVMVGITGTRLYLRIFNKRLKFGLDDVLIIPGVLLATVYPAIQIAMVQYGGGGRHVYDVTYQEYHIFHWLSAVAQIVFFIAVGIIKMSITAFNMRLTSRWPNNWNYAHWTFFALLIAYTLIAFFLNVFTCVPAMAGYDAIGSGKLDSFKCMSIAHMGLILRCINITMDFMLLAVPIIVLWSIQMSWIRKARIIFAFAIGALACIGSVMTVIAKLRLKKDSFWNYTDLLAWTLVEITFGVIAASLPVLGTIMRFGGKKHSTNQSAPYSGNTGNNSRLARKPNKGAWRDLESKSDNDDTVAITDEVIISHGDRDDTDSYGSHSAHVMHPMTPVGGRGDMNRY